MGLEESDAQLPQTRAGRSARRSHVVSVLRSVWVLLAAMLLAAAIFAAIGWWLYVTNGG
jgi:hypothetical protein